jgi:hypothetical protein
VSRVLGRGPLRRALQRETPKPRDERQLRFRFEWPVASRSHQGDHYLTTADRCTCAAFTFGRICDHVREATALDVFGPMERPNP